MADLRPEQRSELISAARAVMANAYAPASHFHVGAAVLAADGRLFVGCNVENASYGLTVCAERNAVAAAIAAGARQLIAVAVATRITPPARPCGACRQVLAEFGRDMMVLMVGTTGETEEVRLSALLPDPFTFGHADA